MLRQIDLRGFKSFAHSTTLELGPGLNVVVGPNGSGKSNLAEAIVWAMGEQRASRLRASGMGEVVYSGGAQRPPAGLAEVSLTFTDGEPEVGRPSELQVTRRVTRAGDAGYRINGSSCRLLDIHESLAQRGLGPDALAVIRQGQVEAVCTSRPSDIRAVLEEAAGVALSRRRRRRVESRLAGVDDRLDRARDLLTELQGRHAVLSRQALAAERVQAIESALEEARERSSRAAAHAAARALQQSRAALAAAQQAHTHHTQQAQAAAAAASQADRAYEQLTSQAAATEALRATVRMAAARVGDRRDFARERLQTARHDADRRAHAAREAQQLRQSLMRDRDAAATAAAAADAAYESARADQRQRTDAVTALREAARAAQAAHEEAGTVMRRAQAAVRRADEQVQAAQRAVEAAAAEQRRTEAAADTDDALARAARRAQISAERATRGATRQQQAEQAAADALSARDAHLARRRELQAELSRLSRGEQAVAGLGHGVRVEAGYEDAMGAALGDLAGAACGDRVDEAMAAVHEGATCAVVPAPARPLRSDVAGARPLMEVVVECPDTTRRLLAQVLEGCFVVDDLAQVPMGTRGIYVTPAGDLLRPASGVVTRGDGDWARNARRAEAAVHLARVEADCAAAEQELAAARRAVARATRRARAAQSCAARAEQAWGTRSGQAAAQAQAHAHAVARHQDAIRVCEGAEQVARDARAALPHEDAEADTRQRAQEAAAALQVAVDAVREAENAAATAQAERGAARVALAELQARDAALTATVAEGAPVDLEPAERALAVLERTAAALGQRAETLVACAETDADRVAAARTQRQQARSDAAQARERAQQAAEGAHQAALVEAAAAARADQCGPATGDDPGEVDLAALAAEVEALERRRRAAGVVNPLAAEERDEVAERIADTTEQVEDLDRASASLRDHLTALDDAVAEGFDEVFQAVRRRFEDMVAALFPGGRGRLQMVGDEEDPGVEIQVVPSGKRARPLGMLSGGERSLVALAFCLAIATARPAPFYLLDEVEAALDDTNLRRLLAVVRSLAGQQQFIMITHQQPTVEIADTLFGVTMAADGVSEIVSRRLDRGPETGRRFVRRQLTATGGGRA